MQAIEIKHIKHGRHIKPTHNTKQNKKTIKFTVGTKMAMHLPSSQAPRVALIVAHRMRTIDDCDQIVYVTTF
jgi:hypothetical protein